MCLFTVKNSLREKLRDLQDAMPCQKPLCFLIITIAMLLRGRYAMPYHLVHLVIQPASQPASIKASLGAGSSTLMLAGLHADLQIIAPARLFI